MTVARRELVALLAGSTIVVPPAAGRTVGDLALPDDVRIDPAPPRARAKEFLGAWSARLFETASREVRWHLDVDPIEFD